MCTRWLGSTPRKYYQGGRPRCRKTRFVRCRAKKRTLTSPYVCVYVGLSEGVERRKFGRLHPRLSWGLSKVRVGCCSRNQREKRCSQTERKRETILGNPRMWPYNLCIYVQLWILLNLCKTKAPHFKRILNWIMNVHLLWRYSGM